MHEEEHVVNDDDVLVRVPSPSPRWRDWTLTSEPSGRIRSLATSLIWTMGVCTTEENYHTLELCTAQMENEHNCPKEYTQAHSEKSDTVKWRNVMKCDQCDSEVFRWSSLGEHVCRVVQKS